MEPNKNKILRSNNKNIPVWINDNIIALVHEYYNIMWFSWHYISLTNELYIHFRFWGKRKISLVLQRYFFFFNFFFMRHFFLYVIHFVQKLPHFTEENIIMVLKRSNFSLFLIVLSSVKNHSYIIHIFNRWATVSFYTSSVYEHSNYMS